jgi:hypothetical protein
MNAAILQTDFQLMVSGEPVNIPRKHKTAITDQKWRVPMVWAGNQFPKDYTDTGGCIVRRVVVADFLTCIESRNTRMKSQIIEDEMPTVMMRCIYAYRQKTLELGGADFWTSLPKPFRDRQLEAVIETNSVVSFLENGGSRCTVKYEQGAFTTLADFSHSYRNYMQYEMGDKTGNHQVGSDYFPMTSRGYVKEAKHVCVNSSCGKLHTRANCGQADSIDGHITM